jgi:ketoreductase RED2
LIALVTGSTSGIGRQIALELAGLGYNVIINSSQSHDAGIELEKNFDKIKYFRADISKETEVKALVDFIEENFGTLDLLVNNAGKTKVIAHEDISSASKEIWRDIFETNLFGTWDVISQCLGVLGKSDNAQIINIASIAGIRPTGSSIPYAVSKAAIIHLTKLLAKTLGPKIRVNCVSPGLIDTPWTKDWDVARQIVGAQAPLKRSGVPQDVADAVLFLARCNYITGQNVLVDGGWNLTA